MAIKKIINNILKYQTFFNNLKFLLLWIMVTFSCLHLCSRNLNIPDSMQYLFFLSLVPSLFLIPKINNLKVEKRLFFPIIVAFLFMCYLFIELFITKTLFWPIFFMITTYFYFIWGVIWLKDLNIKNLLIIAKSFIFVTFSWMTIDTIYRFMFPGYVVKNSSGEYIEVTNWYMYKMNSLIEFTSNDYGIIAAIITCFALYLAIHHKQKNIIYFIIWGSLITFLSLSRAAFCALTISFIILLGFNIIKKDYKYLLQYKIPLKHFFIYLIIFCILFCILGGLFMLAFYWQDYSFLSKFEMIHNLWSNCIFEEDLKTILLGNGFDFFANKDKYGYKLHDIASTYVVFFGLIGLSFLCLLLFSLWKVTYKKGIYIILPVLIYSISENVLLGTAQWFYVLFALLYAIEKQHNIELYKKTRGEIYDL